MTFTPTELGLWVAVISVAGVVVGGLVAGGFAIFTGRLEDRREHKRWLREKRYEVYVSLVDLFEQMHQLQVTSPTTPAGVKQQRKHGAAVNADVLGALPALFILGPRKVTVSAARATSSILSVAKGESGAEVEFSEKRAQFIRDAQDVLQAGLPRERVTVEDAITFKEIQKERSRTTQPRPLA